MSTRAPTPPAGVVAPGVVAGLAAGALAATGRVPAALLVAGVGLASVHAQVVSPRARRAIRSVTGAVARRATAALSSVVLTLFWALVVVPVAAVGRAVGRDDSAGRWVDRDGHRVGPRRPFAEAEPGPAGGRAARRRLLLRGAATVLVLELVAAGTFVVVRRLEGEAAPVVNASAAGYDLLETAALRGRPWAAEAQHETGEVSRQIVYTPFTALSIRDYSGRYVNVRNRVRRSYQAPATTPGEPLDVWFFGGSTMFGFDLQRDLHTIPSEVVREAERDGREIRARNYGTTAHSNYQETVLLSLLLTGGEAPDLIVFYDGINDTSLQLLNLLSGLNPTSEPSILSARQLRDALVATGDIPDGTAGLPAPLLPQPPRDDRLSVDEVVDAVTRTYAQGVDLARVLGEAYDVPVLHFWQPDIYSRTPLDPGEEAILPYQGLDPFRLEVLRRVMARVRAALPAGVIDISDAYDALDGPVLTDVVHVNEEGAAAVAAAMYPDVRAALERR